MRLSWLSDKLKERIRSVFEPRYFRKLTEEEVQTIADNLTGVMETYVRFKLRKIYENKKDNS